MKKIRPAVLLRKVEKKIYQLERRIIKMSTKRYELEDLAKSIRLQLDIKEKHNG